MASYNNAEVKEKLKKHNVSNEEMDELLNIKYTSAEETAEETDEGRKVVVVKRPIYRSSKVDTLARDSHLHVAELTNISKLYQVENILNLLDNHSIKRSARNNKRVEMCTSSPLPADTPSWMKIPNAEEVTEGSAMYEGDGEDVWSDLEP